MGVRSFGSREERCWYENFVEDDLAGRGVFVSLATTVPLRPLGRFIDGIPDCRWTRGLRGCGSKAGEGIESGEGDFVRLNICLWSYGKKEKNLNL